MLKVQILDKCPYCKGETMVFVIEDTDYKGEPFDRYRPCSMCHGSGEFPKWVSLETFQKLLQEEQCSHEHTSMIGGMRFSGGDVLENIEEVCDDYNTSTRCG